MTEARLDDDMIATSLGVQDGYHKPAFASVIIEDGFKSRPFGEQSDADRKRDVFREEGWMDAAALEASDA